MAFILSPILLSPEKLSHSLSRSKSPMPTSRKPVKRDRPTPLPPIRTDPKPYVSLLTRALSSDSHRFHNSFVAFPQNCNAACARVFTQRSILALLIEYTPWKDVYALASTCRQFRHIMRTPELKDVILARFVPGFQFALQNRDFRRLQDVPATIRDLSLLMISQRVPLHKYQMHTSSILALSLMETDELEDTTRKLVALSLAHTRFVLLLQALVHSSPFPPSQEPEEARWKSRLSQPALRELVFPVPLSYMSSSELWEEGTTVDSGPSSKGSSNTSSPTSAPMRRPSILAANLSPIETSQRKIVAKSKFPFFGNPNPPPPPPSEAALKLYSGSWRRSVRASTSDDDFSKPLQHPRRRFVSADLSSESSICGSPSTPMSRDSVSGHPPSPMRRISPHDLEMATSRVRSPILRVFVPCSSLSVATIQKCEEQLAHGELWRHLSTGDIVCNLGYVPPTPEDNGSSEDEHDLVVQGQSAWRKWLIFNGYSLVPFDPSGAPPLEDSLTLPSPFYYLHILPAFTSPTYILRLPPYGDIPELTLIQGTTKVRSPHSPNGFARVTRFVWTARLSRQEVEGIGEGWQGEWVLEAEGTKEGREAILECLKGEESGLWECEVIRERSGNGKLWLKLLNSYSITDTLESESI